MEKISDTLKNRNSVHGNFTENSYYSQQFKNIIRRSNSPLNEVQMEALDMIVHKISRILAGDPNHKDHWHDIAGYAILVEERIHDTIEEVPISSVRSVEEKRVGLNEAIVNHLKMESREIQKKKEAIDLALGEVSALFMSQPIKGTEIVMPSEEILEISDRLFKELS